MTTPAWCPTPAAALTLVCHDTKPLCAAHPHLCSYIHDDPGLVPLLEMLRASGKKLFVVSRVSVVGCVHVTHTDVRCCAPRERNCLW